MALPFYNWSRTASDNATADATVNWAEGQSPSSVNDSGRAMMASTAAYRDDVAGAITTGGSATAYTVTSYQVFDTLAHLNGQMIAFVPHATNTNAVGVDVTLNVDGLGAKSIRAQPSVALPNGSLVLGTPYCVVYNSSDAVFYLHGMTNPYNVPLGSGLPFFASTAPNSSFAFPYGQAISRTTYATLFVIFSTQYGVGDGSSTFNLPDLRGRVLAGKDDMGGSSANRLTGVSGSLNGDTLGATGGTETHTLDATQLPSSIPYTDNLHSHTSTALSTGGATSTIGSGGTQVQSSSTTADAAIDIVINPSGGGAHPSVQPTIICNYILRII
jgi:microcystin-dependent protein